MTRNQIFAALFLASGLTALVAIAYYGLYSPKDPSRSLKQTFGASDKLSAISCRDTPPAAFSCRFLWNGSLETMLDIGGLTESINAYEDLVGCLELLPSGVKVLEPRRKTASAPSLIAVLIGIASADRVEACALFRNDELSVAP